MHKLLVWLRIRHMSMPYRQLRNQWLPSPLRMTPRSSSLTSEQARSDMEYIFQFGALTNGRVFGILTCKGSSSSVNEDTRYCHCVMLTVFLLDRLKPSGDTFLSRFPRLGYPRWSIPSLFVGVILNRVTEEVVWSQDRES